MTIQIARYLLPTYIFYEFVRLKKEILILWFIFNLCWSSPYLCWLTIKPPQSTGLHRFCPFKCCWASIGRIFRSKSAHQNVSLSSCCGTLNTLDPEMYSCRGTLRTVDPELWSVYLSWDLGDCGSWNSHLSWDPRDCGSCNAFLSWDLGDCGSCNAFLSWDLGDCGPCKVYLLWDLGNLGF